MIAISYDETLEEYYDTLEGAPWVALPLGMANDAIDSLVTCTGWPTIGVINGYTGAIIKRDCGDRVDHASFTKWLRKAEDPNFII